MHDKASLLADAQTLTAAPDSCTSLSCHSWILSWSGT